MDLENKSIYLYPEKKDDSMNPIASIMKTIVAIEWVLGGIGGLIFGIVMMDKVSGWYGFFMMILVWLATFLSGLIPYGFAEIISLLHDANHTSYRVKINAGGSYSTSSSNQSGTETVEKKKTEAWEYEIVHEDAAVPFSVKKLGAAFADNSRADLSLYIKPNVAYTDIGAVLADIVVETRLGEVNEFKNAGFTEFRREEGTDLWKSTYSDCSLSQYMCANIKTATVRLNQYSVNGKTYVVGQDDYFMDEEENRSMSIEALMTPVYSMQRSAEIRDYFKTLSEQGKIQMPEELSKMLSEEAEIERMYGSTYKECVKRLEKYFATPHREEQAQQPQPQPQQTVFAKNYGERNDSPADDFDYDVDETFVKKSAEEEVVFCTRCGKKLAATEMFCTSCGERVTR